MFYYMLANIPPHLRSTQRSIQLIACVTSPNIKNYGYEAILRPFIDDINRLCTVMLYGLCIIAIKSIFFQDGFTLCRDGIEITLHATLLAFLADTLAAHQLAGFKVGVGWSFRKCRVCLATKEEIQSKVCVCTIHVLVLLDTLQ